MRRRASITGFHSSKCVLRNEQRRAVAAVFRRVVPLRFAMVANEHAELIARSAHRSGDRGYVLDQIVELAAGRIAVAVIVAKAIVVILRTPRAGLIALAALISCAAIPVGGWIVWTKFQFGDAHRIDGENWVARLDTKTVRRVVAASDFHASRCLGFLVGFNREFLARGSSVACRPLRWRRADGLYAVSSLLFIAARLRRIAKTIWTFRVPATGNCGSAILTFVAGVAFLALLSIQFDFGSCVNPSREHPYFTSGRLLSGALIPFAVLCVWGFVGVPPRYFKISQTRWIDTALPLIVLGLIVVFSQRRRFS